MTARGWLLFCLCVCACGRSTLSLGEDPAPEDGDDTIPDPIFCGGTPCLPRVIDPDTGECVQALAGDGTPCETRCLPDATCMSGSCVGVLRSCDDGDACTADVCDEQLGCTHGVVECPGTADPCEEARCDSVAGCIQRPAPDGSECGMSACGARNVCRDGQCGPAAGPAPTLVGAWSFNESSGTAVLDSSGRGHSGVLVAGTRVPTLGNGGITNTGQGILIDVPDHPDFEFSGSFTVQAWIQTPVDAVMGQQVVVFRGDAREGLDPFILSLHPGEAQFAVMGPEDGMVITPRAQVAQGAPYQLTGVFDAEAREARLYVQCALSTALCSPFDQPMRGLDPNSTPGVAFGSHAMRGGMIYQFRGILDEVRLYAGALDAETIALNCNL